MGGRHRGRAAARAAGACAFLLGLALAWPGPTLSQTAESESEPRERAQQDVFPPWKGHEEEIEKALSDGKIVLMEQIGRGVTNPHRVTLEYRGQTLRGIWKPLPVRNPNGAQESYAAEVAAYRLSRYLGLDRVPPTVARKVRAYRGSLQLWVDGVSAYVDRDDDKPPTDVWTTELARMRGFDLLIDNPDRNQGNFLIDDQWRFVWIDHSRAMGFHRRGGNEKLVVPQRFDRTMIEGLRELDGSTLDDLVGGLLPRSTRKALLRQRDLVLEEFDAVFARRGEAAFLQ